MSTSMLAASSVKPSQSRPIICVADGAFKSLSAPIQKWAKQVSFRAKPGSVLLVPDESGSGIAAAVLGVSSDPFITGALTKSLPEGNWHFEQLAGLNLRLATIGFLLGGYRFDGYKKLSAPKAKLVLDRNLDRADIERQVRATATARDLINTPANDMGPDQIEVAARSVAKAGKASVKVIKGDDLLSKNFPMIHAVGKASTIAPRLIDFSWCKKTSPKVTLVGKGVAFDTGGLDIKPASSMRNMKKDMGGAANVLALAQMIMDAKLDVRLRVLIPAVENSISGNAFRPGDVLSSRKSLTVEIGHTDAEGRLILADALALACEEKPDLIIDMATLTGAARVALGPEVSPFFSNDDELASGLEQSSSDERDPLWRLPLWQNYNQALSSHIADLNNVTTDGFAGAITAALFLERFIEPEINWAHFDIFGWNPSVRPHAPVGGEAQGIRSIFAALTKRFS